MVKIKLYPKLCGKTRTSDIMGCGSNSSWEEAFLFNVASADTKEGGANGSVEVDNANAGRVRRITGMGNNTMY